MDAYKKAGRGGAGNFWSKTDIEEVIKKDEGDIESQKSKSTTTPAAGPPPEYLHSGRGGAGNWVKPSDLAASGLSQNTTDNPTSTAPTKKTPVVGQSKPTYRGGRGGAGNYYEDSAADEKQRAEEEERKRNIVDKMVARDVEAGLAKPARAYGGMAGGAFEMKEGGGRERVE